MPMLSTNLEQGTVTSLLPRLSHTQTLFTLNFTVFNATFCTSLYISTTCFGHIGPSSGTISIVAKAVSL
jgi:hypothetical protein